MNVDLVEVSEGKEIPAFFSLLFLYDKIPVYRELSLIVCGI